MTPEAKEALEGSIRPRKAKRISAAQAKTIAELWGSGFGVKVGGYLNSTLRALVKAEMLVPGKETGHWPNGDQWIMHVLSDAALAALTDFLLSLREPGNE